jgi:hypothetical protein
MPARSRTSLKAVATSTSATPETSGLKIRGSAQRVTGVPWAAARPRVLTAPSDGVLRRGSFRDDADGLRRGAEPGELSDLSPKCDQVGVSGIGVKKPSCGPTPGGWCQRSRGIHSRARVRMPQQARWSRDRSGGTPTAPGVLARCRFPNRMATRYRPGRDLCRGRSPGSRPLWSAASRSGASHAADRGLVVRKHRSAPVVQPDLA